MTPLVSTIAALVPIVLVLVLLACRVRSARAGVAGLVAALAVAATMFRPDDDEIVDALTRLGPTVLEVVLILFGGVALATALSATGRAGQIASWLGKVSPSGDRLPAVLLLVFGLTPFMESVTGFGLGVVITAPLLVRLGLSPVRAVVAGLLGLVLVPWGSLGPGTLVAAELGGQDPADLGAWSAVLTLPVLAVSMVVVLVVVLPTRPTAPAAVLGATVVVVQWGALVASNAMVGMPPSGILASAAVMVLLVAVARLRPVRVPASEPDASPPTAPGYSPPAAPGNSPPAPDAPESSSPLRILLPFAVLLAGILCGAALLRGVGPGLGSAVLSSPALWVIVAALVALSAYATPDARPPVLLRRAVATWAPVSATAVVFMLLGIVMATSGMAAHLAHVAAGWGEISLALIPAAGALGGYLTGSNTGAAAMFSAATTAAAADLGADTLVALAGQNVAGSYAIIASPPRIALAVGVVAAGQTLLPRAATRTLTASVIAATTLLCAAVILLA